MNKEKTDVGRRCLIFHGMKVVLEGDSEERKMSQRIKIRQNVSTRILLHQSVTWLGCGEEPHSLANVVRGCDGSETTTRDLIKFFRIINCDFMGPAAAAIFPLPPLLLVVDVFMATRRL